MQLCCCGCAGPVVLIGARGAGRSPEVDDCENPVVLFCIWFNVIRAGCWLLSCAAKGFEAAGVSNGFVAEIKKKHFGMSSKKQKNKKTV